MENLPNWVIDLLLDSVSIVRDNKERFKASKGVIVKRAEDERKFTGYFIPSGEDHFTFIARKLEVNQPVEIHVQEKCPLKSED